MSHGREVVGPDDVVGWAVDSQDFVSAKLRLSLTSLALAFHHVVEIPIKDELLDS